MCVCMGGGDSERETDRQRQRASFLVNHKLVLPKENLSAKTHLHLLSAAVIIHSNEGGLKFILRLYSPGMWQSITA
jgi:hypothetical protein